jgi:8-oxo-dGTP diphosphatase
MSAGREPVDVAVGVLIRPDGRFLLASRPAGKPYAGYWEFPGGKLEPGESVEQALTRELHEELGIDLGLVCRWVVRVFDYPHARVRLHFCRVFDWSGELHAREAQQYGFFSPADLPAGPLLPATVPVLRWFALPDIYAISAVELFGADIFLERLERGLARGLRWLQLREPELSDEDFAALFPEVLSRVRAAGGVLLVNSRHAPSYWSRADGVHLRAADLGALSVRPAARWVAASVHDRRELQHAQTLNLDFAVAGAVNRTATHPQAVPLGWDGFERLVADTALPVYALGGLRAADCRKAQCRGAHGVALLSAAWSEDHDQCLFSSAPGSSEPSCGLPAIE